MIAVHCTNPECSSKFTDTYFVDSLQSPCPSCREKGSLVALEAIHLILPDKNGPLHSSLERRNYRFLCEPATKAWFHGIRHPRYPVYYTRLLEAASCSECLRNYGLRLVEGDLFQGKLSCPTLPVAGSQVPTSGPTTA